MTPTQEPVCYICHDTDSDEPLMEAPCGKCQMHVHQSCFDTHQVHQFQTHQCVMMKDGKQDNGFIVYTSCSVCKTRHEYKSTSLTNTFAQQLQRHDSDEEARYTGHRQALVVTQFICSLLAHIPESIRDETQQATHTFVNSLALLTEDDVVPQLKKALLAFKSSLYVVAFSISVGAVACCKSSLMYLIS